MQNDKPYQTPNERLTAQTLKRKLPQTITISSPPKRPAPSISNISIEDMVVEFADETIVEHEIESPKIINIKPAPKILNKQSTLKTIEPMMRQPVVKTNDDGKVEVISEILETEEPEFDPIKCAQPVETNVFPCNYCERSFPLRQLLDIHVANHVRDRKFQCSVCKKGFFSKYDLGKHELIHTGEKPFKCVVCGKAFSRSTLLRRHEKIHSDEPKFLCVYCERPFLSREEWDKHTLNHQKKRPFVCEICGKTFAFKQGLERHEVVHSTEQPYNCEHCDRGFSTQGKLARHLTAHAGDRPYPCRICDKSYLLSHHLTRHMRSHKENNQISHKCSECSLSFSKRDELIAHSTVHATENMICPLCKTTFDNVDEVNEHIKQHTEGEQFACEFCDLIFLTETALHEHSDTQHLEEIELYEMSNMSEGIGESLTSIKPEAEEIIEYSEQVAVLTPNEELITGSDDPKPAANRSYGKPKPNKKNKTLKITKGSETEMEPFDEEEESPQKKTPIRSPNTRAAAHNTKNVPAEQTPVSTRSKVPSKAAEKTPPIEISRKKSPAQSSITKFVTVKAKGNEPITVVKKVIQLPTVKRPVKDEGESAKPPNKLVKVKQIRMTKDQMAALSKEGQVQMIGGQMIFKQKILPKKK